MRDVMAVLWKERIDYLRLVRSTIIIPVIPLFVFGILIPLQLRVAWINSPFSIIAWVWLPLLLTTAVVADSVAGERERHTLETLLASCISDRAIVIAKIIAPMVYALSLTVIILLTALITVNIAHYEGAFVFFAPFVLISDLTAGLLSAAFVSSIGVIVSLRSATVRQAQQMMTFGVLALSFLPVIIVSVLPFSLRNRIFFTLDTMDPARAIAYFLAILLAADMLLIALAFRSFRRTRIMEI